MTGGLSQGGAVWRGSRWALDVSQAYTVSSHGVREGRHGDRDQRVPHADANQTFTTEILEGYHQAYGVGMPIISYFSQRIAGRGRGRTGPAGHHVGAGGRVLVLGRSLQHGSNCVYFRPRDYWPSGTTVGFTGHLDNG